MEVHDRADQNGKSIGQLIRELAEDLSTLVRSEVALAKLELKQAAAGVGTVAALLGAALFCALCAMVFVFVTIVLALSKVVEPWLAALIVAVVLLAIAAVLGLVGKSKVEKVQIVPTATVESVKANVDSIKSDLARLKREAS